MSSSLGSEGARDYSPLMFRLFTSLGDADYGDTSVAMLRVGGDGPAVNLGEALGNGFDRSNVIRGSNGFHFSWYFRKILPQVLSR